MRVALFVFIAGCRGSVAPIAPDAAIAVDAGDAASNVPLAGFGQLTGMCGVLAAMDFTSATPELVRDTFAFDRAYVDPADRPLLTMGGQRLAEVPNAGGSSQ